MMYFRVKIGYGKDEFISVDESELSKALRAQVKGTVVIFNEGSVSGKSILSVTPDYQREMGWSRDYVLMGEDYSEIGSSSVQAHRLFIEKTMTEAQSILGALPENKRLQ